MKINKTIHVIHGIHTSEGTKSTSAYLIPNLERNGYTIKVHEYGYVLGMLTRFQNPGTAKRIAPLIKDGDIILAHSNGAYITWLMLKDFNIKPSLVIFLQPALDKDIVFPKGNYKVNVFWNEEDKAVWFAKLLPFHHPFGEMGRQGYIGEDLRVNNYNSIRICGLGGHSLPYQKSEKLRCFITLTIKDLV